MCQKIIFISRLLNLDLKSNKGKVTWSSYKPAISWHFGAVLKIMIINYANKLNIRQQLKPNDYENPGISE